MKIRMDHETLLVEEHDRLHHLVGPGEPLTETHVQSGLVLGLKVPFNVTAVDQLKDKEAAAFFTLFFPVVENLVALHHTRVVARQLKAGLLVVGGPGHLLVDLLDKEDFVFGAARNDSLLSGLGDLRAHTRSEFFVAFDNGVILVPDVSGRNRDLCNFLFNHLWINSYFIL